MHPAIMPVVATRRFEVTLLGSAQSNSTGSTVDFGNFSVPSDGLLVVAISGRSNNSGTVSSALIGGTAGTIHVTLNSGERGAIASRAVAAGLVNVTIGLSTTQGGTAPALSVFVYLITGLLSTTPTATASNNPGTNGTSITNTIDVPSGGATIFAARSLSSSTAPTWSSAIQQDQQVVSGAAAMRSALKLNPGAAIVSHTETHSWSGSGARSMVSASWA